MIHYQKLVKNLSVLLIFLFSISLVTALQIQDKNQSDFNAGSYNNTYYNTTTKSIQLNLSNNEGSYQSQIFFIENVTDYNNINWNYAFSPINYLLLHLNELSGSNISDSSGNNRNGIAINSPLWISGKLNNALRFDGANDYVNFTSDIGNFERTEPHSYEFWIKTSTTPTNNPVILGKIDYITYRGWYIFEDNSGTISLVLINALSNYLHIKTLSSINNASYHHIIITYDGTSSSLGTNIYIDSINQSRSVVKDNLGGTILTNENFKIGRDNTGSGAFFNGDLDEIIIYNKVLSQSDVTFRYNLGLGTENPLSTSTLDSYIRSCNDINCNGETFINISNTPPVNISSLAVLPYIQYQFIFSNNITEINLYNVTIDYSIYVNEYPIINQYLPDINLNLFETNCINVQWNITTDDNLTYATNNNIINISSIGLITGCYDNTSIGLYPIEVNTTDTINQNVSDSFDLTIYLLNDLSINQPIVTYSNLNLYNVSITFDFDEISSLSFEINNISYSGINNTIHTFNIQNLNENTIYNYNVFAIDIYNNNITFQEQFKTPSFEDINIELQKEQNNFIFLLIVFIIIFALYIVSEVFSLVPVGIISGVALVVFSLSIYSTIDLWLFLTLIFSGLFILVRFLIGYFTT